MDPLPHRLAARNALQRIKPEHARSFLGKIEHSSLVEGRGTGVAYLLGFRQIGFATAQLVLGLLAFIDVNGETVPLDDVSTMVAQRLSAYTMPAILAVRP